MLSWLYADQGALAPARALATQLAESGRAQHSPLEEGRGRWVLAEVLRRDGDLDAADREVAVALAMAVPLDRPGVLATLSALRLAQGRAADALAATEDAVARSEAMGGCGMFRGAFVRLVHAEALHATGAHDAAARAIVRARATAARQRRQDRRSGLPDELPRARPRERQDPGPGSRLAERSADLTAGSRAGRRRQYALAHTTRRGLGCPVNGQMPGSRERAGCSAP